MEMIVECCLYFLYVTLMVISVGLLLVHVVEGRSLRWLVLFMVSGVTLSWFIHSNVFKVGLVSVLCGLILYVGREEATLLALNRAVLITGCDSGLGNDLARFLDRAGMRVFAGVLDEFSPGALDLKISSSSNLTVLQLDVTNRSQIAKAHQYIQKQTAETGLWALVNNAGVLGYVCDGEILPIKTYKKYLNVNFIGSVEVTQVFLPLIRQSKGRIISISSMAGEVPLPGFAAYGASKAALFMYSGAIRQELSRWGVKVIVILPGAFKTNILGSKEQWSHVQEEVISGLSQDVTEAYGEEYICSMQQRLVNMSSKSSSDTGPFLEALKHALLSTKPKKFYYPGAAAWALPFLYRHCPTSLSDTVFSRIFMTGKVQPAQL
ncbi:estradiol 17-beta-dehydrogenase 2 [Myxocyprinus asiaticus]|uniref:estradiol 17-beta-dehydrogenase 2 n=1 Tax=Myxocyprinus asiaticus TaxID=70543 RepID=UPI002221E4B9|nr:estradiol 17-beta-dehydrogenase 2 [Myxocyprinus asiaticus]